MQSALLSAEAAEEIGLPRDKIILSAKVSQVQDLIAVYAELARRSNHALHLGLTEAGMGSKGIVASSAAMGILLQQGIGDTIRISLTPEPNGDRTREVQVAQELLQTMGFRQFVPIVAACPGCGRTTSTVFQELAQTIQSDIRTNMPVWREKYPGVEALKVAVMGCIVNGPGESKHADIGISLPGTGEMPAAPVFIDGKKAVDAARPLDRRRFPEAGRRLYRAAFRARRQGRRGVGRCAAFSQPPLSSAGARLAAAARGARRSAGQEPARHHRPHLRAHRNPCRPQPAAARFLRAADLEGEPVRSERRQSGRRGRHRAVHAGHRSDARADRIHSTSSRRYRRQPGTLAS